TLLNCIWICGPGGTFGKANKNECARAGPPFARPLHSVGRAPMFRHDRNPPAAQPALAKDLPKGGTIRIAARIPKLDSPPTYAWVYDSNICRQVCGYMTRTGVDNVTRPHLASKWEASEDLKTWTFTISD